MSTIGSSTILPIIRDIAILSLASGAFHRTLDGSSMPGDTGSLDRLREHLQDREGSYVSIAVWQFFATPLQLRSNVTLNTLVDLVYKDTDPLTYRQLSESRRKQIFQILRGAEVILLEQHAHSQAQPHPSTDPG